MLVARCPVEGPGGTGHAPPPGRRVLHRVRLWQPKHESRRKAVRPWSCGSTGCHTREGGEEVMQEGEAEERGAGEEEERGNSAGESSHQTSLVLGSG